MSILAIATYRPLPGKEAEFAALLREHAPALRAADVITDRPWISARSTDGTIIEIFEWKDEAAKNAAHKHPVVMAVWRRFDGLCEIRSLDKLPEAQRPFACFQIAEAGQ